MKRKRVLRNMCIIRCLQCGGVGGQGDVWGVFSPVLLVIGNSAESGLLSKGIVTLLHRYGIIGSMIISGCRTKSEIVSTEFRGKIIRGLTQLTIV